MTPSFSPRTDRYQTGVLPLPVASPEDTAYSYFRRAVFEYWQAGRRDEKVDDADLDRAARNLVEQSKKLINSP